MSIEGDLTKVVLIIVPTWVVIMEDALLSSALGQFLGAFLSPPPSLLSIVVFMPSFE